MSVFTQTISRMIWEMKYRNTASGGTIETSLDETLRRVAQAIAVAEKPDERAHWERAFYEIMAGFRFLPGGRILAGAGTSHAVTLFNCFVMNIASDSMTGIFDALREGALTLQQGGGIGYDFSVLRPAGVMAEKTGIPASGPVSFMQIWDAMCGVLLSTGARRGAMMGVLSCDHPDIEAFIDAKADARLLRHFNVSVRVSDAFMQAVKNNETWPLVFGGKVYRIIQARELWKKMIRHAYDYAEPGVLFGDTINRMNNLWYCERINATNPCGEIPLPAYGACDLGAVNLSQFVIAPFTKQATVDWTRLIETTRVGTRFLDNVISVSRYPLRVQQEMALNTRRIGLGVTGLGDLFIMLGMRYGSEPSVKVARDIMKCIADTTWQTSIELAKEKGRFPLFSEDYLRGPFVQALSGDMQQQLRKHGVRNSHHNTVAPAGTISLLANNVSNGIEPAFQAAYHRKVTMPDGELKTFCVKDYAFDLYQKSQSGKPPAWVDTNDLTPEDHLAIQSAVQPYIDNAISKTINLPADFPFSALEDVYTQAYAMGLKGCTIFRPNEVTGSVLETNKAEKPSSDHCCP